MRQKHKLNFTRFVTGDGILSTAEERETHGFAGLPVAGGTPWSMWSWNTWSTCSMWNMWKRLLGEK